MSADNSIIILCCKDGYRVFYCQAIENIYYWYNCCNNPNVVWINGAFGYEYELCLNCESVNPGHEKRNELNPKRLKEYFEKCEMIATKEDAIKEAEKINNEIGYVEYGIREIYYDGKFLK